MQGLFRLGVVGTKEQMLDFIEKSRENKNLKDWIIADEETEAYNEFRRFIGGGFKKFLDKYKLVIDNTASSGNINGIEEAADEISRISPEVEVMLLTQLLDFSGGDWTVYYYPSGKMENIAKYASISTSEEAMYWRDMKDNGCAPYYFNIDEAWDYCVEEKDMWDDMEITKDMFKYYIAYTFNEPDNEKPEGYERDMSDIFDIIMENYWSDKVADAKYSYVMGNENLPALSYVSRLFEKNFVDNYRFIPQTFDNRFSGKVFVVTGEPDDYGHEKTEELISKFGGIVRGAVSGKTDYLIIGEYAGNKKAATAKELGVKIIDVDEFEKMISD